MACYLPETPARPFGPRTLYGVIALNGPTNRQHARERSSGAPRATDSLQPSGTLLGPDRMHVKSRYRAIPVARLMLTCLAFAFRCHYLSTLSLSTANTRIFSSRSFVVFPHNSPCFQLAQCLEEVTRLSLRKQGRLIPRLHCASLEFHP